MRIVDDKFFDWLEEIHEARDTDLVECTYTLENGIMTFTMCL